MKRILPLSLLLLATACTDLKTLEEKPADEGTGHNYTADYASVVKAARSAVPASGFTLVGDKAEEQGRMLLAESGIEKLRIIIEPDDSDVIVRIISSSIVGGGSADNLFDAIASQLNDK